MHTITHTVSSSDDGRQIKRVIRSSLGLSYHQYSMLKASGAVLLDGVSVHANHVVREGQEISLTLVERIDHVPEPEDAPLNIVYEDEHLLVIDKCAPLACQSSPKQAGGTLENRLAHYFSDQPGFIFRPVNRLDKGTSGLMIAAKHAHAQMLLSSQLHSEALEREYLAVTCGVPDPPEGVIEGSIRKAEGATVRREVHPDGKYAKTAYLTLETHGAHALLRLKLFTGRTHQIRVHLNFIGCPVAGDFLYGAENPRLPGRFALHSAFLSFTHPVTGEKMRFESPLPDALKRVLEDKI